MDHPSKEMAAIPVAKMLGLLILQALFFCIIGLSLWVIAGREQTQFITIDLPQIGLGLAIAAVMIALGHILFRGFPRFGEKLVRDQVQQFAFLEKRLGISAIIIIAACAGIGEEALFRGGVLTLLDAYIPFVLALIISASVFTVIHFAKPAVAIFIFIIGVVFGLIYWWSGSLLAVMIAHWVYDIWALWFIQEEMHRLRVFDAPHIDPAIPGTQEGTRPQ